MTKVIAHAPSGDFYKGTLNFINDANGENPRGFTIQENNGTVNALSTGVGSHDKLFHAYNAGTGGGHTRGRYPFTGTATGTVELWTRVDDISTVHDRIHFYITDGAFSTVSIHIGMNDDTAKWWYYDGSTHDVATIAANTWYHHKIEFDCADDWHWTLDDVSLDGGVGYAYRGSPSAMDNLELKACYWNNETNDYFDAIGFSWDPDYSIGDNKNKYSSMVYKHAKAIRGTHESHMDYSSYDNDKDIFAEGDYP